MARNTSRKAAKLTPAAAFRKFTATARKSLSARIEATRKLAFGKAAAARDAALAGAGEARVKTLEAVTNLEKVFEQRVARAMSRLGVPSSRDVRALSRRVAQLQASVESLKRSRARA